MATSIRKTKNIKTYFALKLLYGIIFVNIEWFESELCTCIIDDVWEHRVNIEWFESVLCTCIIDDVWEHRVNIEWFGSELCTCIIDDVWEHRVITKQHHCVIAHECVGSLHQKNRSYHKCDTIIIRVYGVYL